MPLRVIDPFHDHVHHQGCGLRDVAILVAAMEHFAYAGQPQRVHDVARELQLPTIGILSGKDFMAVVEVSVAADFLLRMNVSRVAHHVLQGAAGWGDVVLMMQDELARMALCNMAT